MGNKSRRSNRGVVGNVLILIALTLFVALALPGPAQAEVIDVPCQISATLALGQAIEQANDNPGPDTIRLEEGCTYGLFSNWEYNEGHNGLPEITDELTIIGRGARLERMVSSRFRLLKAAEGAKLTIVDLTLANGYADDPNDSLVKGGAIYTRADLTLDNVAIAGNRAGGPGGGVYLADGNASITYSQFEENESVLNSGGGLFVEKGEAYIVKTSFRSNVARRIGGGAVLDDTPAFLNEIQFEGNVARGIVDQGGGGLAVLNANASIFRASFAENRAYGYGGALFALDVERLHIAEGHFEENIAGARGGGAVLAYDVGLLLNSSRFLNNVSGTGGAFAINGAALALMMKDQTNSVISNNLWVGNHCAEASTINVDGLATDPNANTVWVAYNTMADPGEEAQTATRVRGGRLIFVDNIVTNYATGLIRDAGAVAAGYNLYETADPNGAQVGDIAPYGDGNFLLEDPLFVDRAKGDYRLQPNSPAVDQAYDLGSGFRRDIEGTARPQGDGYDIGAYEYVPQNTAPVAKNDNYATLEDTKLTVAAPGVLGNDEDEDGDGLTARLESLPQHGALTLQANGGFTYTPDTGYVGQDSFTYKAYDGEDESNVATVSIEVQDVNEAPTAKNDSYTTLQDAVLTIAAPGVLDNDEDADGDELTAVLQREPDHGSVTLNANGSFTYTPDNGYSGTDSFRYRAHDGQVNSNTATVTITVEEVDTNVPPAAVGDKYEVDEGTTLTVAAPGVLGNDGDANGDALTAVLASDVDHGQLTLNANGSFSYTPDAGYVGQDAFTYRASDGQESSNVATVTIEVREVNEAPVAGDDQYLALEDTELTVSAPGVLGNDDDADGDALTARLESLPDHGTVALEADGSFVYVPDAGYVGQDAFTYRASDGQENSNVATVTVEVQDVNETPVAADDSYLALEDTALTVQAPGVLDNDEDGDDDALTATLEREPQHGTVTLDADGSFTYTPESGYVGEDSFTYRAYDGEESSDEATVTITVEAAGTNLAPVAVGDSYETEANRELLVAAPGVLGNDADANGDALTALLVTGPAYGELTLNADGSFTYTPDEDFAGEDSFTYQAGDGVSLSNVVTVRIWVVGEHAPQEPLTESVFLPVFVR